MITFSGLKHIQQQRKSLPKAVGRYVNGASSRLLPSEYGVIQTARVFLCHDSSGHAQI